MKDKMSTTIALLAVIAGLLGLIVIQNFANMAMNQRSIERHDSMMRRDNSMDNNFDRYMMRMYLMRNYPYYYYNDSVSGSICPLVESYMGKSDSGVMPASRSDLCVPMGVAAESSVASNVDGSSSVPMPSINNSDGSTATSSLGGPGDTYDNVAWVHATNSGAGSGSGMSSSVSPVGGMRFRR